MVRRTSPLESRVLMDSFSKSMVMPKAVSFRTRERATTVFLAKRERDLVRMRSNLCDLASAIISCSPWRCLVFVLLMPSSL